MITNNAMQLKGGFLIAAIVGLDSRATMDLDTTIKGFELTHDSIRIIFEGIFMTYLFFTISVDQNVIKIF